MSKAAELAALIGSQTALSNRNLVINGAMQVAQRGTSTSSVSSGFTYPAVDRIGFNVNNGGTWTVSQSTDTPSGQGFGNSFKLDCTTADTSLGSGDYLQAKMRIEANTLQGLAYNTSSAKSTTLSFWVKSAKTGTYILEWLNEDASNKHIARAYTIDSANTWEKKELTIPGDVSGVINNDNGKGMELTWWLGAGSNFTSSALQTSWGALDQTARATGVVNLADSTSNDWYITGIQWEVGEQTTPFEHESYGVTLQKAQRYYYRIESDQYAYFATGKIIATSDPTCPITFPTAMRATPSITASNTKVWYNVAGSITAVTSPAVHYSSGESNITTLDMKFAANATLANNSDPMLYAFDPAGYLDFDAEL